ncbi:hypothetical protein JCGZ_03941 [Jatropha curcas]|uniref:Elongin-A n=1 Tax=Jatropha curcas TaxID=180498 RepID=A0A067L5N6_JATCU|nr:hypothetical protein JCGZ_03941 [Jatropha curcas]
MPERKNKAPSLVDLCVDVAISNVRYLGDVGETDLHLLDRILPHCTMDQLIHIEKRTEGRDLSPVTDKLWKRFFEREFGVSKTNDVIEKMRRLKVSFRWKELYEAKLKDIAQEEDRTGSRLRQSYQKENAKKQSRQVRLCTKVPPSSKRSFYGGSGPGCNLSNVKSNIMKKSKIDFLKSREVQNIAAMKKISVQRNNRTSSVIKPSSFPGNNSASSSKPSKSLERRF